VWLRLHPAVSWFHSPRITEQRSITMAVVENEATEEERHASTYEGLKGEYGHIVGLIPHLEGPTKEAQLARITDIEASLEHVEDLLGIKPGTHAAAFKAKK
jgi:hypothetical protein